MILIGLGFWIHQLTVGLVATGMSNAFSFGLYIATFAFLVGIAAGGMIVSSSIYLFNVTQLKPLATLGSLIAFAGILAAGVMVLPDLGYIANIGNIFIHANLRSPLVWDITVIICYMVLCFFSVYFQLLPRLKEKRIWFFNGWTKRKDLQEVERFSQRWSKVTACLGLPFAVLIHTVTALIFATQSARPWWNTAALPPDFISIAVASGTALVMLVTICVFGRKANEKQRQTCSLLARITAVSLIVHFFLTAMELILTFWWGSAESDALFSVIFGSFGWLYALELILPAVVMILFFNRRLSTSPPFLICGSLLLFAGVFAHRLMLLFPAFGETLTLAIPSAGIESWVYPIASGRISATGMQFVSVWDYLPTGVELAIVLLPLGLVLFIITLGLRLFPVIERK
jgi:molybdopterin-containing oxidoreductase family membrane subunit